MLKMRAKLFVSSVVPYPAEGEPSQETVHFNAVYKVDGYGDDGFDENNNYAKFTPAAHLEISITNPALLGVYKPGQHYYVDFTPVDSSN